MRINELFSSFQGEGKYSGCPATFLRLSGCNLKCDFCDTDHTIYYERNVELLKQDIEKEMTNNHTNLLVITGGEPLLQYHELKQLIKQLNCRIQIETNGSIIKIPLKATYVISPKENIEKIFCFYKNYDKAYFKFLIRDYWDINLVNQLTKKYYYDKTVWLQPVYENAEKITELILNKAKCNYRISGQLHKYLNQR